MSEIAILNAAGPSGFRHPVEASAVPVYAEDRAVVRGFLPEFEQVSSHGVCRLSFHACKAP